MELRLEMTKKWYQEQKYQPDQAYVHLKTGKHSQQLLHLADSK